MSQALYRKYRSRSLDEIVGQEHITKTLERAIAAGRISHAYLFTGPRGTGKTSIARILAYAINNIPYSDTPNLDIVEIDAASNRRIDDIRDLREKVHIAPVSARYKVYIIDEVHMLTGESFNALLKTLEEPPSHVVFILATTEVHKLPATIISRTQRFSFRPASNQTLTAHLKKIAQNENINITDEALEQIALAGDGSYRDSISLLDQLAHVSTKQITAEDVNSTLGLAPIKIIDSLLDAVVKHDHNAIRQHITELESNGGAPGALAAQVAKRASEKAVDHPQLYELANQLLEVPRAYHPGLKLLTTVMLFVASGDSAKPTEPQQKTAALKVATPSITLKPTSKPQPAPQVSQALEPDADEEPADPTKRLTDINSDDWQKVLELIKKKAPALFAVLKYAKTQFAADTQELTLYFKYQLHRKKTDDPKQKAAIVKYIQHVLGGGPTIKSAIGEPSLPAKNSNDPVVSSVAAIMGGGEVIDAEKI